MKLSMPRGLFRKYLVFLLVLVGGVLSVSSAVDLYFSYREAEQSIVRLERTKAQAAGIVARILQGTRPQDLPVESADDIALAINLETARLFALDVPRKILLRADVIQR